jgi:NDP-sugar pyrophosphorylase family protein
MKVVLFCGGLGTRIREYSESIPKPMIPVGHQPILWHVMQYYSEYGHTDFILTLGYKANIIKEFFLNYRPQVYTDCVVSGFGDQRRAAEQTRGRLARVADRHRDLAQYRRAPVGRARLREE